MNAANIETEKKIIALVSELLNDRLTKRKAKNWYVSSGETICVLNLQRSMYSARYYVNFGIFLDDNKSTGSFQPAHKADITFRLENHLKQHEHAAFHAAFDLENPISEFVRLKLIEAYMQELALPMFAAAVSHKGVVELHRKGMLGYALGRRAIEMISQSDS